MTVATLTKTRNGTIALPEKLRRSWQGADVFMRASEDTIILKRVYQPAPILDAQTVKKLKSLGRKITGRNIDKAVKWARQ